MVAFHRWAGSYLSAPADLREAMLPQGMALAKARRATLARMIREYPEQALAAAVPVTVRAGLPTEVTEFFEEQVSGRGELALLGATPMLGKTVAQPVFRHALIGRQEYEAFTYGNRANAASLTDVSIEGIALDGELAVNDSPLEIDQQGDMGGEVVAADGAPGSSTVTGRPSYAWTHGEKKVLIIRVDFSDKTGTPVNNLDSEAITPAYAVNLFNDPDGIRDFYDQCSYGQTSLLINQSTDVTSAVLRMPATAASYATGNKSTLLHSDARALAQSAGYAVDSYDRVGVVFGDLDAVSGGAANNKFKWAGLGNITGKNFWVQSQYTFGTVAHEIGHNYGLNHANRWSVADGDPVSPSGTMEEYGDPFDVMGGGGDIAAQFDVWKKSILQWLPDSSVKTVSSNGTFRLYRFDAAAANLSNSLALKVVRNSTQDYWIGYRRATDNPNLNQGASIVWGGNRNDVGVLLDMTTPGDTPDDAPLAIGATFNDNVAGITLHPVAQGGSGADEWLDVEIGFQSRISWSKSAYDVDEASGNAKLVLKRDNNSAGAVSVHWATSNNTATSPADFTASSGNVTWADGDMADKVINIPVTADAIIDSSETFSVTLSGLTDGVLPDGPVATVTLIEAGVNDPSFKLEFINSQVEKVLPLPDGSMLIGGPFSQFQNAAFEVFNDRGGIGRVLGNGAIDTAWGVGGGAGNSSDDASVYDLARQPDGKILVAGSFATMHGVARNGIARLNPDGTLDSSFDPGTGANSDVHAVLVQPDGKILLGGYFTSFNGTAREYLARLNSDGSVDSGFVGPNFAATDGWRVNALALQADGKLLVAGSFYFSSGASSGGLCRVTSAGARDASFNGITTGSEDSSVIRDVNTIAVQRDGMIVVGGNFTQFNGSPRGHVARLTAAGALDGSFVPTSDGSVNTMLVQNDGKIVLGGDFITFNGSSAEQIVRLNPNGSNDSPFSTAGGFYDPDFDNTVFSLGMQADGKILAAVSYAPFQTLPPKPLWRMFGGLPSLPGTIQLTASSATATEGQNAVLTVSRNGGAGGALSVNYATVAGSATNVDFTSTFGVLTWADGDAVDKTISIPITSDASTEGDENFTVNLGQALLGGAILGSTQSAEVIIHDSVSQGAYATWRNDQFTVAELADPAISGDLADPDHDGVENLLEFAFELLPKTPDAAGLPSASVETFSGDDYVALTFRRPVDAPELVYTVETNSSLSSNWVGNAVLLGVPAVHGDGTETVTYRDIVTQDTAEKRFMRVKVSLAP